MSQALDFLAGHWLAVVFLAVAAVLALLALGPVGRRRPGGRLPLFVLAGGLACAGAGVGVATGVPPNNFLRKPKKPASAGAATGLATGAATGATGAGVGLGTATGAGASGSTPLITGSCLLVRSSLRRV